MKMNKKGFTLIELLAVIVILAVIALIASPIVLGIIENSRESSQARSIEAYAAAVQDAIATVMSKPGYAGGDVTVSGTTVTSGTLTQEVAYSGNKIECPNDGVSYDSKTGYLTLTGCNVTGSAKKFNYTNNPADANSGSATSAGE